MGKQKVLVTTSTYPRWEKDPTPPFVNELCRRLTEKFEIHILAPYSHGSKRFEHVHELNVHRYRYFPAKRLVTDGAILPNLRKNRLFYAQLPFLFLGQLWELRRIVKSNQIRLLHAHWLIPQGLIAVVYKMLFNRKIRVIVIIHGGDIFGLQGKVFSHLQRRVLNNASFVTAVSRVAKEHAYKTGCRRDVPIEVLPMGVDFSRFHPKNYNGDLKKKYGIRGPFLLFVGRLTETKGVRYLIQAMPSILESYPRSKLLIIGDGEEGRTLQELAKELLLYGRSILFLGGVPNHQLPEFYATADIFVGPSITEGLGLVYIEALGSGCAVVCSDLPAVSDIITDRETGVIVEQRNPEDISRKVVELLTDNQLSQLLKKKGGPMCGIVLIGRSSARDSKGS